eukprot:11913111-Alexandrium_andersonii.AAC.1
MSASLVGSEMCIRDRSSSASASCFAAFTPQAPGGPAITCAECVVNIIACCAPVPHAPDCMPARRW